MNKLSEKMSKLNGDEIVISGISGIFPEAGNVEELGGNLFQKVDMVKKTKIHPHIKHPEYPQYAGKVKGMEKFDASFFRVTPKQALSLDVMTKKVMEHAFGALFDAGVNPETMKGSRLGVYMGSLQTDSICYLFDKYIKKHFMISGCSKCMIANRVSYWIDGKGPSYTIDNGCTGSTSALEMAYTAMKNGNIDCAMVGGCSYNIKPELALNVAKAGLLCTDGKTKCFDKQGDGYVRSEAVTVYFLQKAKDAKRVYAEIYHVKGKYFASPDGLFSIKRNPRDLEKFLEEFYSEVDVCPNDVEYVEANCFGIADADGNELEAVGNVFAKEKAVKIGSIKSNIGNTEPCSGACAITKMCLSYQKGLIPANLHYKEPQNDIHAIKENKLQVVVDNQVFNRNFTAINDFCYTGSNFHALLKGHFIPKQSELYNSCIPRLVLVSSRQEDGVNEMLNILETNPVDPEQIALLNNFFKYNLPGYTGRGYSILDSNKNQETVCLSKGFEYFSGQTRPVCFLYSGMGSQWAGMGEALLRIPVFAATIERCQQAVTTKEIDIVEILTDKDDKTMNIFNSVIAIAAIQIGLTDVLTSIGINPDYIIGHSLGEIASAYADKSLTTEEAILAAYFRAVVSYETKFIKGAMAAVGLGHKEIAEICPPEIEMACHNSKDSTTISGPFDIVTKFVKHLTDRGVFAKEVFVNNIAFHSKYIAEAGPIMLNLLKQEIPNPKRRSNKWISSSYLPEEWHNPESHYASAEYFTHNLLNNVLFEETAKFIPKHAIIIELAPHGLLQAIMKRSHSECLNLSLTRKGEIDSVMFFLKAIGKLYLNGLNLDLEAIYPKVTFPVSTETPLLSQFVKWNHEENWVLETYDEMEETPIANEYILSIYDDEYSILKHHTRNGTIVLPEAIVLVLVWKTLAEFENKDYKDTIVVFDNVQLYNIHYIKIYMEEIIRLEVTIQKGSKKFEVLYKNAIVADGIINLAKKSDKRSGKIFFCKNEQKLTQNDIYSLLKIKGDEYREGIQSIISSNLKRNTAAIKWSDNWIFFLDALIQMKVLNEDFDGISCTKLITKLTINTEEHKHNSAFANGVQYYAAFIDDKTGTIKCGGVTFEDIVCFDIPKTELIPVLDKDYKVNIHGPSKHVSLDNKMMMKQITLIAQEQDKTGSLTWCDTTIIPSNSTIQVFYAGLSSKDCKKLSSFEQHFGMDFSGIDVKGDKVMGLVSKGAIASTVEPDYDLLWPVPQHWSLAEAATVPLPYTHALYCLAIRCHLSKNSTILIIGAAGSLGQAIISIALHFGCTVFGTVGNVVKKKFLLKLFPQLDANKIGFTYDNSFRDMVIGRTKNERCNIVINTGCGKVCEAAMDCVGKLDTQFLDVNDTDQKENKCFGMSFLTEGRTYKSVNMSTIFNENYTKIKKLLQAMMSEGIAKGYIKPIISTLFTPLEVPRAFKLLINRSNIGKVLISIHDLETANQSFKFIPKMTLLSNKVYIVICDDSELGVELITFLVQRGAKRLVIHCNPKIINGYFQVKHALWIQNSVDVEICSEDIQTEDQYQQFIDKARRLGSVDGIFITFSNFERDNKIINGDNASCTPFIVTKFDQKSRDYKLRYFVVIAATKPDSLDDNAIREFEECCSRRSDIGLPCLFLHHVQSDKVWKSESLLKLFNVMETSLKYAFVSVSTEDKYDAKMIKTIKVVNADFDAGLKAFFKHISPDEIDATEPVVQMKTTLTSGFKNEFNLDPENTCVIMIPGFDGNAKSLGLVAEQLKKPAIALQMNPICNDSITEIAKGLLKHVKSRIQLKSPFYLVGYSFGVNIALDIANLLEKEGLIGFVYCIDSSPDALRIHLDSYLGHLTEEQLQNSLVDHMYKLCTGHSSDDLIQKLKSVTNWSDKVEMFTHTVKTEVSFTHEYLKNILHAAYDRFKLARHYKPNFVLESELILLKGTPHPNANNLNNDYNLSMYTNKPVQVYDIQSDHAMALNDCRISNFINKNLVF